MSSRPSAISTQTAEPAPREVPYVDLGAQFAAERAELMAVIEAALSDGHWVGGERIERFERRIAERCAVEHAVALNSGTDALVAGMAALGIAPGDEVITPPNSFIASTAAIVHLGAKPVFVDVLPDQTIDPSKIEAAITSRTRALMPVHLTGRMAQMNPILEIARRHGLFVVEDAAQAIGARYRGRPSGSFGHIGCFSTHPLKNLNACGDGGFLVTNEAAVAEKVRLMRNHGLVDRDTVIRFGYVSRMDAVQAAILDHHLDRLDEIIALRRRNAGLYRSLLEPSPLFIAPEREYERHTYHTFVIHADRRDELRAHLSERGIGTAVHYPIPIHRQPAARGLGYKAGDFPEAERQAKRILSLPIGQTLTPSDVAYVARTINRFCAEAAEARRHRGPRLEKAARGRKVVGDGAARNAALQSSLIWES